MHVLSQELEYYYDAISKRIKFLIRWSLLSPISLYPDLGALGNSFSDPFGQCLSSQYSNITSHQAPNEANSAQYYKLYDKPVRSIISTVRELSYPTDLEGRSGVAFSIGDHR